MTVDLLHPLIPHVFRSSLLDVINIFTFIRGNVRKWIDKGHVAIDPDLFPELLTELRIAQADVEMSLDKTEYSMDLLDSLRLSMEYIVY